MTHTAEQERALSSLRHLYQQMAGGMVKDSAQAKRIAEGLLSPAIAKLEQAARRAPAVPVPQGWKLVPDANNMTDEQAEAICNLVSCCGGGAHEVYEAALSAAPQTPEAQASVSNGTLEAPVQMPELESRIDVLEVAKELKQSISAFGDTKGKAKEKAAFYLTSQYEQILYWEQQVRQLLAAHGIQEQST